MSSGLVLRSRSLGTVPSRSRSPRASSLGRWALAGLVVLFAAGCADDEQRIAEFLERGAQYVEDGADPEAIIEFKNVLQLDPENADAHEALSLAFLRVEKPREAYWEMSETVRVDPSNVDARLRYGTISAAIGDFDLSNEQAEAVLALDPDNAAVSPSAGRRARTAKTSRGRKRTTGRRSRRARTPRPSGSCSGTSSSGTGRPRRPRPSIGSCSRWRRAISPRSRSLASCFATRTGPRKPTSCSMS